MKSKYVDKGWGHELIHESNEQYCMKELHFKKKGYQSSMHFHKNKTETWIITSGSVKVEFMDMSNASTEFKTLNTGDVITINPMTPHQITCLEDNTIVMESSSMDERSDNYRIRPGDSQVPF